MEPILQKNGRHLTTDSRQSNRNVPNTRARGNLVHHHPKHTTVCRLDVVSIVLYRNHRRNDFCTVM